MNADLYVEEILALLQQLISIPSFSREEDKTAGVLVDYLERKGVVVNRSGNNVWAINQFFDPDKPTVLLNSHHDTVMPNPGYTHNPFDATIQEGKLFGLGSNDAGGPLVSLLATFLHYYSATNLAFNLVMSATAEEEISGRGGIESIWSMLPTIDFAIVGEPTSGAMAVAEKGLLVLDCIALGKAGHAARNEGENALYAALPDIEWFRTYRFPKRSETLGDVKMTVTMIQAGQQHNSVPATCSFTVDVRVTDAYTLKEILDIIQRHVKCAVTPRSVRLRSSYIPINHPLVLAAEKLGIEKYGSPTTSDQALIPVPSVKIGPGDSSRSHMADEYIRVEEIRDGIERYIELLKQCSTTLSATGYTAPEAANG